MRSAQAAQIIQSGLLVAGSGFLTRVCGRSLFLLIIFYWHIPRLTKRAHCVEADGAAVAKHHDKRFSSGRIGIDTLQFYHSAWSLENVLTTRIVISGQFRDTRSFFRETKT